MSRSMLSDNWPRIAYNRAYEGPVHNHVPNRAAEPAKLLSNVLMNQPHAIQADDNARVSSANTLDADGHLMTNSSVRKAWTG